MLASADPGYPPSALHHIRLSQVPISSSHHTTVGEHQYAHPGSSSSEVAQGGALKESLMHSVRYNIAGELASLHRIDCTGI
jgi:hypothetical protein